jgi:hypothetical protein
MSFSCSGVYAAICAACTTCLNSGNEFFFTEGAQCTPDCPVIRTPYCVPSILNYFCPTYTDTASYAYPIATNKYSAPCSQQLSQPTSFSCYESEVYKRRVATISGIIGACCAVWIIHMIVVGVMARRRRLDICYHVCLASVCGPFAWVCLMRAQRKQDESAVRTGNVLAQVNK